MVLEKYRTGNKRGIGSHQSARMQKDEWLTPPFIINALGAFDLDPCAPLNRVFETATNYFTVYDDGLKKEWLGRVYCNPPYGLGTAKWLAKLADHGNGIALVFARTETKMFFDQVWSKADAVLFLEGRLFFHHSCGKVARANSGAPSALIAYGKSNAEILDTCGIKGKFIKL